MLNHSREKKNKTPNTHPKHSPAGLLEICAHYTLFVMPTEPVNNKINLDLSHTLAQMFVFLQNACMDRGKQFALYSCKHRSGLCGELQFKLTEQETNNLISAQDFV